MSSRLFGEEFRAPVSGESDGLNEALYIQFLRNLCNEIQKE